MNYLNSINAPKNRGIVLALLALTACVAAAQLGSVELFSTKIYSYELLMMVWVMLGFLLKPSSIVTLLRQIIVTVKNNAAIRVLLIIVGCGWLIAGLLGNLNLQTLLYLSRYSLYAVWGWQLWRYIKSHSQLKEIAQLLLLVSGVLVGWYGLLQYAFLPDTRFLAILGWDDHLGRLISTPLDPGFTGLYLVLSLLLALKLKLPRHISKVLTVFLGVCTLLTYSRSSYLSLLLGLSVFVGFQPQAVAYLKKHLIVLLAAALITILAVSALLFWRPHTGEGTYLARTSTITARFDAATATLKSMNSYQWVIGQGLFVSAQPNTRLLRYSDEISVPNHSRVADNSIIFLISQLGLGGTFAIAMAAVVLLRRWRSNYFLLAAAAATILHSFFAASLTYSLVWMWWMWSLATFTED